MADTVTTKQQTARTVNLILPHPPATNNLYFTQIVFPKRRGERAYTIRVLSAEARKYKEEVGEIAAGLQPFLGDVWVTFRWYRPRRVGDLDGIFKVILDGLTGYAYQDDKQVARIYADRFECKSHPRVEVEIRPLDLC